MADFFTDAIGRVAIFAAIAIGFGFIVLRKFGEKHPETAKEMGKTAVGAGAHVLTKLFKR